MTQERTALVTTVSIWAVFFIFVLLIPMPEVEEKTTFGEMSIRLEPLTDVNQREAMQSESQSMEQAETTFTEATIETAPSVSEPLVNEVVSNAPVVPKESTPATTPAPRREQVLSKSIEELMAEQNNRSQNNADVQWSDDIFAESATNSTSTAQESNNAIVRSSSSLSGSAAQSGSSSGSVVSQGETARAGNQAGSVSSETSSLLQGVTQAKSSEGGSNAASSQSSQSSSSRQSSSSGYAITFSGEPRRLLYPSNPTLIISPENQRLIQSNRNVEVTLSVGVNGTVSPTMITFTPSALIPAEIQSELRQQIARWRFEEGQSSGQATFIYSIIVE